MKKILFFALLIITSVFITTGCSIVNHDKVKEESISIKKDKAKDLDVKLDLGAGAMTVTSGSKNWVDGMFEYSNKHLKPNVSYDLKNSTGVLRIDQTKKGFSNVKLGKMKNEWDLELTNKIPLNLDVNTGASKTYLDLQGLQLQKLDIETGVGELTVELSGDWKKSFETNIQTGVGKTTVILPSDVGVKVISSKGIGKANVIDLISKGNGVYVNEAYKDAKVKLTVNVELGAGEVNFKLD